MAYKLLRIHASASLDSSTSRKLADQLQSSLQQQRQDVAVSERNLHAQLPMIDAEWIEASYTPEEQRSERQKAVLELSDQLIAEIEQADHILLATPMYNFSAPAALKAWIDMIARVGKTFQYTETGPQGLIADKPVTLVVTTGGTPINSGYDFLSGYLERIFNFIGISNVTLIAADRMNIDADAATAQALEQIETHASITSQAA